METSQKDDADINARQDEVEALTSIYPGDIELKKDEMIPTSDGDWKLYKQRGAIIIIRPRDDYGLDKSTSLTVRMDVSTPPDYPSRSSPSYRLVLHQIAKELFYYKNNTIKFSIGLMKCDINLFRLSAPFLRGEEKEQLIKCLDNRYDDNPGECILFDWIEIIKDHIQQFDANLHLRQAKDLGDPVILSQANIVHIEKNDINDLEMCMTSCDISSLVEDQNKNRNSEGQNKTTICPDIYTSDVIEDRKSVFQGHFARVDDVEKVHLVLDKLKENKKIKNASHPTMYAYRIQQKGNIFVPTHLQN
jgi:hypothetical protein